MFTSWRSTSGSTIRLRVGRKGCWPSIRDTTCGSTSTPPLAIAAYIEAIWIGVTLMPWPIGMLPIEEPYQSSGFITSPLPSPYRCSGVSCPKPNR